MATRMKSWHVVVLDRCKTIVDKEMFSAAESKTLFNELKKQYAETHPHYTVSRDWY